MNCVHTGTKTPSRVQEPFTAEFAESAEPTRWLSGLGGLEEMSMRTETDPLDRLISPSVQY